MQKMLYSKHAKSKEFFNPSVSHYNTQIFKNPDYCRDKKCLDILKANFQSISLLLKGVVF